MLPWLKVVWKETFSYHELKIEKPYIADWIGQCWATRCERKGRDIKDIWQQLAAWQIASLGVIALRLWTPGFSSADLANLLNEAAIVAGRRGKDKITLKEIDDTIDQIVVGMEGTKMTDGKSKILVAYHEIGHAVCQ